MTDFILFYVILEKSNIKGLKKPLQTTISGSKLFWWKYCKRHKHKHVLKAQ